ncbi:MAG: hypothetical protein WCI45_03140 [Desulfuromonadales bacterium]
MIGLGSIATTLNPYLLYIKIALVAIIVAGLAWFGWHEKSIRADLDKYKAEAALQKASAEMYAQQFNNYIQLNKEIADAIKKVRVQSNTYIDSVEVSQPPVADGDSFVLIPPGVPKALPRLPGYQNYSAGRTSAAPS